MNDKADKLERRQLRLLNFSFSRRIFLHLFVISSFLLLILPFWNSIQDVLTNAIMRFGWYASIQNVIVPYELRLLGSIFAILHFPVVVSASYVQWSKASGGNEVIYLAWNCVGWQTLVLFIITLITGLSGRHTVISKFQAVLIGILGTYLTNIFRLFLVILIYYWVGRPFGIMFHDYFSNLLTLVWLFYFWWFSSTYVLEDKPS